MNAHTELTKALYNSGCVHSPDYNDLYSYEKAYIIHQISSLQSWYYW